MIEPKTFYRKLDFLLASIGREKSGNEFLINVINKLIETFGFDLHIANPRIYEEKDEIFQLIYPEFDEELETNTPDFFDLDAPAIQSILKSRIYIFDDSSLGSSIGTILREQYSIPMGIMVTNNEQKWIFIIDLAGGWVREEVEFCINAVRRAINYRLYSEAIKSELQQTARIQQSLLPQTPPNFDGYDIAAISQPAELVGGDLFDYFKFDDNEYGLCIGDASGHGLPAALMVRDVVTGLRMGIEKHMKMVHTLKKLNQVIYRGAYSTSFISLFFTELETNGNLFYINAGHPAPILIHGDSVTELQATGVIFGAFPEIELSRAFAFMEKDSVLVLYSDGITERKSSEEEFFGEERLTELVKKNQNLDAAGILDIVFTEVHKFSKNPKWEDDATLMIIKKL